MDKLHQLEVLPAVKGKTLSAHLQISEQRAEELRQFVFRTAENADTKSEVFAAIAVQADSIEEIALMCFGYGSLDGMALVANTLRERGVKI